MVVAAGAPPTERELEQLVLSALVQRLPRGWEVTAELSPPRDGADRRLTLRAPSGESAVILVEVKPSVEPRDLARIIGQLTRNTSDAPGIIAMVAARYLSDSVRQRLAGQGISFVDATGNIRVTSARPGLFLSDRGADRDPWRGPGRPRSTLQGEPAAKVVRALVDLPGPWRIRELVGESKASTGSVYRVIEYLESEGLVARDGQNLIQVPRWQSLLRAWSSDYGFIRSNTVTRWIAPRGLDRFLNDVGDGAVAEYALTGSVAASAWASYAPARSAWIYASDPRLAAEAWGLREAESGVNVLLAEPAFGVVLERTRVELGGLRLAAPAQVAVDLMTGPGRAPAESEELVAWMEGHEPSWR